MSDGFSFFNKLQTEQQRRNTPEYRIGSTLVGANQSPIAQQFRQNAGAMNLLPQKQQMAPNTGAMFSTPLNPDPYRPARHYEPDISYKSQELLDWENRVTSAADFVPKSQYQQTGSGEKKISFWRSLMAGGNGLVYDNDEDYRAPDETYELVNRNAEAEAARINRRRSQSAASPDGPTINGKDVNALTQVDTLATDPTQVYKQMTSSEIGVYNYIYATEGAEAAKKYLDALTPELNYRNRKATEREFKQAADEHPVQADFFRTFVGPMKGLALLHQTEQLANTGAIDQNAPTNKYSYIPTTVTNRRSQNVGEWMGSKFENKQVGQQLGQWLYGLGASMSDNLWQMALTGGKQGGKLGEGALLAMMGSGVAADTVIASKDKGLSDAQSYWLGLLAGGIEAATELIGLDNLYKTNWSGAAFGQLVKLINNQGLAEGSEEFVGSVANQIADLVVAGQDAELYQTIKGYMADGVPEKEAVRRAITDWFSSEVIPDTAAGYVSGVLFGAGASAMNFASMPSYYASIGQRANQVSASPNLRGTSGAIDAQVEIDKALSAAGSAKAAALARQVQSQMQGGRAPKDTTLGRLIVANMDAQSDVMRGVFSLLNSDALTDKERDDILTVLAGELDENGQMLATETSAYAYLQALMADDAFGVQLQVSDFEKLSDLYKNLSTKYEAELKSQRIRRTQTGISAYTDAGVSLTKAHELADIVEDLRAGKSVEDNRIDQLRLDDPKFAEVFYQLTGVRVETANKEGEPQNIYAQARTASYKSTEAEKAIAEAQTAALKEKHEAAREARAARMLDVINRAAALQSEADVVDTAEATPETEPQPTTALATTTGSSLSPVYQLTGQQSGGVAEAQSPGPIPQNLYGVPTQERFVRSGPARQQSRTEQIRSEQRQLRTRRSEIRAQHDASSAESVQNIDARMTAANQELKALRAEHEQLEKRHAQLDENIKRLENLEQNRHLSDKQSERLNDLVDEYYEIEKKLEGLDNRIAELENQLSELSEGRASEIARIEALTDEERAEIEQLESRMTELKTELVEETRKAEEAQREAEEQRKAEEEKAEAERAEREAAREAEEASLAAEAQTLLRIESFGDASVFVGDEAMTFDQFKEYITAQEDGESLTDAEIAEQFDKMLRARASERSRLTQGLGRSTAAQQTALIDRINAALRKSGSDLTVRMAKDGAATSAEDAELAEEGKHVNASWDKATGTITFSPDMTTQEIAQWVLAHEVLHQAAAYTGGSIVDEMQDAFKAMYDAGQLSGRVKDIMDNWDNEVEHKRRLHNYADTAQGRQDAKEELIADMMRHVLPQTKFWNNFAQLRTPLAVRISNKLNGLTDGNSAFNAEAQKLANKLESALHLTEEQKKTRYEQGKNAPKKFSISVINGRAMPIIDITNSTSKTGTARSYIEALVSTNNPFSTILYDAQPVYIGPDLPKEYTSSRYTQGMRRDDRKIKMQAATNLDEMLLLAQDGDWQENLKEKHATDAQNGWYYYKTEFAVPILWQAKFDHYNIYDATLVIRNDADGKSYLYDLIDLKEKEKANSPIPSTDNRSGIFGLKPSQGQDTTTTTGSQEREAKKTTDTEVLGDPSEQAAEEATVKHSLVEDDALLNFLNDQDLVTVYRAMQEIDGKLYPPMAAKVKGNDGKTSLVEPTEIGVWYQSDERPDLVKKGKFTLNKGNGSSIEAAYNPYFHTSASPLNDQFSSAYKRPNLVVVEGEIPSSELTSGYRAEGAKNAVGETTWHSGPVAGKLTGDKARRVFLSRYFKANRIVPDAEVAQLIADNLRGEDVAIPTNVVTPSLLDELRKTDVRIEDIKHSLTDENAARLIELLDNDAPPSVIFNETGHIKLANGTIIDGDTREVLGVYERGSDNVGRLLSVREAVGLEEVYRREAGGAVAADTDTSREGRVKDWEQLSEEQRQQITDLIEGDMTDASYEGQKLLSDYSSPEAFAERFYTMLQQGRAVAEQWANLVPSIDELITDIKAIDGVVDNKPTEDQDVRYSISPRMQRKFDDLLAQYGPQEPSSRDARDVAIPKQSAEDNYVSRTARTVANANPISEEGVDAVKKLIVGGKLSFLPESNKTLSDKAGKWVRDVGWGEAIRLFINDVSQGRVNGELVARGAILLNNASNGSDAQTFSKLMNYYTQLLHNASMGLEAAKIIQQLTPDGSLAGIMDVLREINDTVKRLNKAERGVGEITLSDELVAEYRAAKTDEARDTAVGKMAAHVASQIRTTNMDRWTAIRYLNMLGNFKTQVRNLAGNLIMQIMRFAKDTVAGAIDAVANANDRTVSVAIDKDSFKSGWDLYHTYADTIMGGGRYNDSMSVGFMQRIEDKTQVFGKTGWAPWDKIGGKAAEKYRTLTKTAMEKGDSIFCRWTFAESIGRFMAANHTTWEKATEPLRARAINKAIRDAAEATYHDNNALSMWVSSIARSSTTPRAARALMEGIMPFRKTPANIAMRAYEYGPLSLIENTIKTIQYERAKNGKGNKSLDELEITGADIVNRWAKTFTGSVLVAIGVALAASGNLLGKKPDDEKEAALWEQMGYKEYSLRIGKMYWTLDWAAPACIPLFLGANLADAGAQNGLTLREFLGSVTRIADPLVEMSMLQGINDTIENAANYGTDSALGNLLINATWGYFSQGLSNTLLGQIKRAARNTRMQTYVDKNKALPDSVQRTVGKTSAKVPGWNYNQIPYIDAWGNVEQNIGTENSAGNAFANVLYQGFSPAYGGHRINESELLAEIDRLYKATGNKSVILERPDKYFNVKDENGVSKRLDLTADQYVVYAQTRGQTAQRVVSELINSQVYQTMTDHQKAEAIKEAYDYANQIGKNAVTEQFSLDSTAREVRDGAYDLDIPEAVYMTAYSQSKNYTENWVNAQGEKVQNSKSLLLMNDLYTNYPELSQDQILFLAEALGVNKTVRGWNKALVASKVQSLYRMYGKYN